MPEHTFDNEDFEDRLALTLGEDERIPGRERPDFWELPSSVGGRQPVLSGLVSWSSDPIFDTHGVDEHFDPDRVDPQSRLSYRDLMDIALHGENARAYATVAARRR